MWVLLQYIKQFYRNSRRKFPTIFAIFVDPRNLWVSTFWGEPVTAFSSAAAREACPISNSRVIELDSFGLILDYDYVASAVQSYSIVFGLESGSRQRANGSRAMQTVAANAVAVRGGHISYQKLPGWAREL